MYNFLTKLLYRDSTTWKQIEKLSAHKLTVTQMRFSPNGSLLLSVSRDRTWALFERDEDSTTINNQPTYRFKQRSTAKMTVHKRIIWTCDWSHDGKYFSTGGRDAVLGVWAQVNDENNKWDICLKETYSNPVTALAFAPKLVKTGLYQVAIGFSNGDILLQQLNEDGIQLKALDDT